MRFKLPTKKSQSLVTSAPTPVVWPLDPDAIVAQAAGYDP